MFCSARWQPRLKHGGERKIAIIMVIIADHCGFRMASGGLTIHPSNAIDAMIIIAIAERRTGGQN